MAIHPNISERGTDGITVERAIPASQPGDVFPAGVVALWAGAAAPTGWIICDGSAVSRATYDDLFANIGTTWGPGDGSTTFNIPDFRDRVPVGKSGTKALASTGGAETHTLTTAQMPSHSHGGITGVDNQNHTHNWDEGLNIFAVPDLIATATGKVWGTAGSTVYASRSTGTTSGISNNHNHNIPAEGSGQAHNIMQPYAAINYIIRAY